ncbi:MAG: response regulator [Candidatus Omnitrophica bacterium]|nr:response regulator [Candidatus Omnitrophota bacterium]
MARNRCKILIIEDDPGFRELLTGILNQMDENFEVRCGGSYREAREAIQKELPDLILLDIYLPDKDGFYFLEEFRKNGHEDIPVVLVSASGNEKDKLRGLELGAMDFINKPIAIEDIRARVAFQLRLKKITDDQKWACQKTNEGIKLLYKELEKKNKKLEQLDQLKDEFVSMVSHELRTPLTAIKSSLSVVYGDTEGRLSADQKRFLEISRKNIDRLARLINDVLDYEKLKSKPVGFKMAENDLNALIGETVRDFEPIAANKNLRLETEFEADLPKFALDRDKIMQVLTNFLNNAVKFSEKGKIRIKTARWDGDTVRVSVEDEGVGIEEENLPKLFQTFSQITNQGFRKPGGTGLGLAISKSIVEGHRGRIGAESVYGKGSTFYFILPLRVGK